MVVHRLYQASACLLLVIMCLVACTNAQTHPHNTQTPNPGSLTTQESPDVTTETPDHADDGSIDAPDDGPPVGSELKLTVRISEKVVNENKQVTISCVGYNVPRDGFMRFVRVNSEGQLISMATNKLAEYDFKPVFKSGRYRLNLTAVAEPRYPRLTRFTYMVTIKSTQIEDSGQIGCTCEDRNATAKLTVQALPQLLELHIPTAQDNIVQVQNGVTLRVECRANGSHPKANVVLNVGRHDLTSHLTTKIFTRKVAGAVRGLEKILYDTILSGTITVRAEFDDKMIQCKSRLPGVDQTKLSKEIMIKTDGYGPRFKCHKTTAFAQQRNVVMRCNVYAKPDPTFKFYWHSRTNNEKITVLKGKKEGHYSASVHNTNNPHEFIMELKMDRVFPQMFREHIFYAENKFGKGAGKVILQKEGSPYPHSAAVSASFSPLAASLCATLLALLRH